MLTRDSSVKKPAVWIVLFFVLLAGIGIFTIRDYGAPYDEIAEMCILKFNIKEYALQLEPENSRSYAYTFNEIRISESVERDHGICGYYLLAPWIKTLNQDMRLFSYVWSLVTWGWFMVGCIAVYGILHSLGVSRPAACAGVLLLYLMPRFFAEGHYNNKDVVVLCMILATLWLGARLLQKPGFARGILFSLLGAMATNTRIVGFFAWGLIGAALLVWVSVSRKWNRKMLLVALVTIISFVLFYLLITPASWNHPPEFFQYLITNARHFSRTGGPILFRGATFPDILHTTPLPWYYLPYWMLVTIPLYTLILAGFAQIRLVWQCITGGLSICKQKRTLLLLVASVIVIVPVGYAVFAGTILYNGWRHFYFVYAGLVILAGYGIHALFTLLQHKRLLRRLLILLLAACFACTSAGIVRNHPYQHVYFNALVPRDAKHYLALDYWNVGFAGAFRTLYEIKKDTEEELRIGCYFNDISIGAFKLPDAINARLTITAQTDAPFLCYNSTYAYLYSVTEPPEGYHVLFSVKSYQNTILVMYEKDKPAR